MPRTKDLPGGIITDVGSTARNKTGSWRTFRPVVNFEKCTGCGICEKFCPEGCIVIKEVKGFKGRKSVIDYDYCKGCLICMAECPFKAIDKEVESK